MAENKHYINQTEENGTVNISEDVLATIVEHAISEVDGVSGIVARPDLFRGKGLKITISEDNTVAIDCNVSVIYGQSVVDIAQAVQNAVENAVESMTAVQVKIVNVNVCGIVRK